MSLRTLLYAYVLGGLTFIPLVLLTIFFITVYTSVPAPNPNASKNAHPRPLERTDHDRPKSGSPLEPTPESPAESSDLPRTRKGWLTVRRTFEETALDGSYVTFVRSYLDARSKDPKRSRPKDTWYVVLKGKVMYLYEDEGMTECEAAVELGGHDVSIYPEGLMDGELFAKRNAICLKPRCRDAKDVSLNASGSETALGEGEQDGRADGKRQQEENNGGEDGSEEVVSASWFIFVRSCVDMEDWYLALVHASNHPPGTPTLGVLKTVFLPSEMNWLVATLDEQPDVIPMRWFNALLGRVFYSFYRTEMLESYIIGRLMKKLSRVKRPQFLTELAVTQFSVGNKAPTFSKPMLKELTKEGDASLEVGLAYKGEIRATVEATAVINLGSRFKSYTVKFVLAVVIREVEGNLLVKVKRPPSSRIWYAFTKRPRMAINVEPIVSDRQITWSMILNTIEAKIEEMITDSVVLPNMDDISFFDSASCEHRGGVWADAARPDKPMTPETVVEPPVQVVVDTQPSEEAGPATLARARTEPEPTSETTGRDNIPIIRSVTTSSDKSSTTARRHSWFSPNADMEASWEHTREVEEHVVRSKKERSTEPNGTLTPLPDIPTPQPLDASDNELDAHEYLRPRSLSTHSHSQSRSSRASSISSSTGGDDSFNYLSDTSATSKSPRHPLGTSTTSSFLSTLRSKAGDKQALSNTAKEAMRKWGVNWGLKKDNSGNPPTDDVPDVEVSSTRQTGSTHGTQSHAADTRSVALERQEHESSVRVNGHSFPIPVPQGGDEKKGRSTSVSGGRMTSHSNGSSPNLSRSLGDNAVGDPFKDRDFTDDAEENPVPSLIHTQPSQARTMTIPGIHASHRGEVMSMGNVAPVSPAPESKPKGATIQSMYRLWKSPILAGQPSQEAHGSTSTSPACNEANDGNHDVAPLSLTPEVTTAILRPVPPPLPPRTVPSVAVKHAAETTDVSPIVPSVSSASQALKLIVSKDETRRVSLELNIPCSAESNGPLGASEMSSTAVITTSPNGKPPPLPPRRIPV